MFDCECSKTHPATSGSTCYVKKELGKMVYTLVYDDVMVSAVTKKAMIVPQTVQTEDVDEFTQLFNALSVKLGNRDGFTKVIQIECDNAGIIGASIRYVPKEGKKN